MKNFTPNLLSVIVRTTASEILLLKKAIKSICNSDYDSIEIIVVCQTINKDAFSEVKLIKEERWINKQISFILNNTAFDERSRNLNIGINNSKGEYIAFLDDDDYVDASHYSNLIRVLKHGNVVMVYTIAQVVDSKGQIKKGLFEKRYIDKLSFYKKNFITIHSYVLKRKVLEEMSLRFNENMTLCEDYAFLLPIYFNRETIFLKKRTAYYLMRESFSRSFKDYKEKEKEEFAKLDAIKINYKLNFFEKIKLSLNRCLGITYQVK